MNSDEFWKLISLVDLNALESEDEEAAVAPVENALIKMDIAAIEGFYEQLSLVLYAIDGEVYADNAGDAGGSDDGFLYARCYVVARGKTFYEQVRQNPDHMPDSLEQWCESLLYVAPNAWADKTGNDPTEWEFDSSVSFESGSNEAQWN
jgi:hypothetical protein